MNFEKAVIESPDLADDLKTEKAKSKALEQEVQVLKQRIELLKKCWRKCDFCDGGTLQCTDCTSIMCFGDECSIHCENNHCEGGYFCPNCIKKCERCEDNLCKKCKNAGCPNCDIDFCG